ncbi:MAG: hypothetical protein V4505_05875 [Pseudomonadota bacterium]
MIELVRDGHAADEALRQALVTRHNLAEAVRRKLVPTERRIRPARRLMSQFSAKS